MLYKSGFTKRQQNTRNFALGSIIFLSILSLVPLFNLLTFLVSFVFQVFLMPVWFGLMCD